MEPYLDRDIRYRKKKGFSFPQSQYLRTELRSWVEEMLGEKDDHLDNRHIDKLFRSHLKGRGNSIELWKIISLRYWLKEFS